MNQNNTVVTVDTLKKQISHEILPEHSHALERSTVDLGQRADFLNATSFTTFYFNNCVHVYTATLLPGSGKIS